MISSLAWIPKGAAKSKPGYAELTEEYMEAMEDYEIDAENEASFVFHMLFSMLYIIIEKTFTSDVPT